MWKKKIRGYTTSMFSLVRLGIQRPLNVATAVRPARSLRLIPDFSKFKLTPQPAGNIVGTVNDAYIPPMSNHYEGGYHWTYERILAVSLVPLTMFPFVGGVEHPMVDAIFLVALLFHCHAGLKSCIIDYIPSRIYSVWHRIAAKLLTLGTFLSMYGVYILETENSGLFDLVRSIWTA
jgi:succinate dehydrogenase (ubiquinone) membrane anchor subunit